MVNKKFDNMHFLDSDKAIQLIENLFETDLPDLKKTNVYDEGIYFGVEYKWENIEIQFGGGRGFFEHEIIIDGEEYSLKKYNSDIAYIKAANEKNIIFAFDVLKKFIAERCDNAC